MIRNGSEQKTIMVTGGAGFIGSAVIRHIINNTQDAVVNLDKLTYAGNLESLLDVSDSERYFFEKADICDREELSRIIRKVSGGRSWSGLPCGRSRSGFPWILV